MDANGIVEIVTPLLNVLKTTSDELRDAFLAFDKEGNGVIATMDVVHALTSLGETLPHEVIIELSQWMLSMSHRGKH